MEPEIAILIHVPHIAGQQPVAEKFFFGRVGRIQIFKQHDRMWTFACHLALDAGRTDRAFFIDDSGDGAWCGPTHRAGFDRHYTAVVGENEIALGLAVHLVDANAEFTLRPFKDLGTDRFAAGSDDPQFELEAFARIRNRAHELQRGRGQERAGHAMLAQDAIGLFRLKALHRDRCHHGRAVKPAREQ